MNTAVMMNDLSVPGLTFFVATQRPLVFFRHLRKLKGYVGAPMIFFFPVHVRSASKWMPEPQFCLHNRWLNVLPLSFSCIYSGFPCLHCWGYRTMFLFYWNSPHLSSFFLLVHFVCHSPSIHGSCSIFHHIYTTMHIIIHIVLPFLLLWLDVWNSRLVFLINSLATSTFHFSALHFTLFLSFPVSQ